MAAQPKPSQGRSHPREGRPTREKRLIAILYSEFDNTVGPKIVVQKPDNFLAHEDFETISDYMITCRDLCHKVMTLTAFGYKFTGYSCCLLNDKYGRNALFFNVCFVFKADFDALPFHNVLCKLANFIESLELEEEFLFGPNKVDRIDHILSNVVRQLHEKDECSLNINSANRLFLKLQRCLPVPPLVRDDQVPVRLHNLDQLAKPTWDLTIYKILPFIDGLNFVKRIACLAEVDIKIAKRGVTQLLYYGLIILVDIFQYSNVYVPTPLIGKMYALCKESKKQRACVEYVALSPEDIPNFSDVFELFCRLKRGLRMSALYNTFHPAERNIDLRRCITFGLINGFIRRVHKYPIYLVAEGDNEGSSRGVGQESPGGMVPHLVKRRYHGIEEVDQDLVSKNYEALVVVQKDGKRMDGTWSYDQICTELERAFSEVEADMRASPDVVIIGR